MYSQSLSLNQTWIEPKTEKSHYHCHCHCLYIYCTVKIDFSQGMKMKNSMKDCLSWPELRSTYITSELRSPTYDIWIAYSTICICICIYVYITSELCHAIYYIRTELRHTVYYIWTAWRNILNLNCKAPYIASNCVAPYITSEMQSTIYYIWTA